ARELALMLLAAAEHAEKESTMTDIIQDAKQLLDGATPAPWGLSETEVTHRLMGGEVYEFGGEPVLVIGGDVDDAIPDWEEGGPPYFYYIQHSADGELMAAAPELAQALAEETYEYAVQVKIGAKWLFLGRGAGGHSFAKNAFWFEKKEKAQ